LSRTESNPVPMRELLAHEMNAHGAVEGENLTQSGPEVLISAKQAQALSMAFHELATNAVKHGALSVDDGQIAVSWNTDPSSSKTRLCIRWRETGITIEGEPTRRGLGTEILERFIPQALNGTFQRTIHRDGVECEIEFALDQEFNDGKPAQM
jgi:two-component sensor histidine kinase